MKCRYLDEITGGRGTVFATGTPISNSMVELYTIQRYLQYDTLLKNDLQHFDSWASTFGETVTAIELTPEGTGYRAKTRFAKFFNLPELMSMFKEVADIRTADMLELPVPKANFHNIAVKPSEIQKEMVAQLAERAENVRKGNVDASVDNMLKITNDGRKLALDQRMLNDMLPDFEGSKINACVDNVYRIWNENSDKKSAQLIFCDLSTPKNDGVFSVYNDIRKKLIERGIPESEVKFIHEADTDVKKKELFQKVRKGEVRVLLGSTQKMGAGTNVQDRLIALHDVDCPWRPSDLEQRAGRIIRQGNSNPEVEIYRYVTEQTFDAYLYQLVEGKQKFASQIMTSKSPVRSADDIDETALSYAEIKMLATGIDLKPFENAVYAIEQLVNDSTAEIFILSATVNSCSLDEKQKWLDRYLPNIDKEHRIFTSLNVPKSEAIGHRLTDKDILIDDYNKNLLEWQKAGGTSVKAKNNINHKGLHGELWKGELIDVVNGDVYSDICKLANENYYYAYIGENDVEKLKQSGICYHLQMSGDRIIAKVSIAYKPILDNIVNSNRSIKCDTGSTPKM